MAKVFWRTGRVMVRCMLPLTAILIIILFFTRVFTSAQTSNTEPFVNLDDPNMDLSVEQWVDAFYDKTDAVQSICKVAGQYHDLREPQKANQLYKSVIDNWPEDQQIIWARAGLIRNKTALADPNDAQDIQADVETLLTDFAGHADLADAIFMIAKDLYKEAHWQDGLKKNEKVVQYSQSAAAVMETLLKEFSQTDKAAEIHLLLGDCYRNSGQYEDAIKNYQAIVDNFPDYQLTWHSQFLVGYTYNKMKQAGILSGPEADIETEAAYQKLLLKYPDSPAAKAAADWLDSYATSDEGGRG